MRVAYRSWTSDEVDFLKKNYTAMTSLEMASALSKNKKQIDGACARLGLRRGSKHTAAMPVGSKVGRWTIMGESSPCPKTGFYLTPVICDCDGLERLVNTARIKAGNSKSCGCIQKEDITRRSTKEAGRVSYRVLYSKCATGAKNREYAFELTYEQFMELSCMNCHYCGIKPKRFNQYDWSGPRVKVGSKAYESATIYVNGIDRKDNSGGVYDSKFSAMLLSV